MSDSEPQPKRIGDMKHGLTSSRPKLSILPRAAALHECRAFEYGADYYARGNYYGPPPIDPKTGKPVPEEVAILGYLDACLRHVTKVTDAVNKALGTGGDARAAIATVDDFAEGKPPSMLPDLGHAMASLAIAIERAVMAGILPADPGQPWRKGVVTEERSPEAAARHQTAVECRGCKMAKESRSTGEARHVFRKDPRCPVHGEDRPGQCITTQTTPDGTLVAASLPWPEGMPADD